MNAREVRLIVFGRDGGCVAPLLDPDAGPCYDAWGHRLRYAEGARAMRDLEIDYIRHARLRRHYDPEAHVMVCPGHHRGTGPNAGRQWSTANRPLIRRYLAAKHPEVWKVAN